MSSRFAKIIGKELEASGQSKTAFASRLGISRQVLDRYLEGKTSPPYDKAVEMLKKVNRNVLIIAKYEEERH